MAFIKYTLSAKPDSRGLSQVYIALRHGSNLFLRGRANIFINAERWDSKKSDFKTVRLDTITSEEARAEKEQTIRENQYTRNRLDMLRNFLLEKFNDYALKSGDLSLLDKTWFQSSINEFVFPDSSNEVNADKSDEAERHLLPTVTLEYVQSRKDLSLSRSKDLKVLYRLLSRYSLYNNDPLNIEEITSATLERILDFILNEYKLFSKNSEGVLVPIPEYRDIFFGNAVQKNPPSGPRAMNTAKDRLKKIRAVLNWAQDIKGYKCSDPFRRFKIKEEHYGDPWYITKEERDHLYAFDMSSRPQIATQRDIFIFQCLIGCRVGDLYTLTQSNINGSYIEYKPSKTRKTVQAPTIRVPMSATVKEILKRHYDPERKAILPFISSQKYNDSIKKAFKLAGLTRMVSVQDPVTETLVQKPLNEIASSHLARRTFIGNLYNIVQDPNLIGSMSGHVAGSKAFERYHDYSMKLKQDLINQLDS